MQDGLFAIDAEPPWSAWRDQALCICGEARLLIGDTEGARALFAESAELSAASPTDAYVLSEAELAMLAMDRGQWSAAVEHVELALAAIDAQRMDDYPTSVLAFAAAARLALHRGDLPEANRQLTRAMRARPILTFVLPGMALRARLQLARVYWAMADHTSARHLLREIDDILLHRPDLGVLGDEAAQFLEVVASSAQSTATGGPPLTPAELRLLPYMQTHLTFREIGERLFVSRNTVSSEVSSIYRKLGVSSRHDAVQQATAIGLLGG